MPLKKKNRQGIKALLALNRGEIIDNLKKKTGALEEIQAWIKQSPEQAARLTFLMGTLSRPGEQASAIKNLVSNEAFDKNLLNMIFDFAEIASEEWVDKRMQAEGEGLETNQKL